MTKSLYGRWGIVPTLVFAVGTLHTANAAPDKMALERQLLPLRHQPRGRGQSFGASLAMDGRTIVAGAPEIAFGQQANSGAGNIFVSPKNGWGGKTPVVTATLTASDRKHYIFPQLGVGVAISGDTVVLGTSCCFGSKPTTEAYVYVKPKGGWRDMTETARLKSFSERYQLSGAVAIAGDTIVAGCVDTKYSGPGTTGCGAVYVKPEQGWAGDIAPVALLQDGGAADSLGYEVAMTNDAIALAAPEATPDGAGADGAVQIYEKPAGGWASTSQPNATLTPSDPNGGYVGYSLGMSGDTVVAGAPYAAAGGQPNGAGYVYVRPGKHWRSSTETAKLTARTADVANGTPTVGQSAAISGGLIALGANGATPPNGAFYGGEVFMYLKPVAGWADTSRSDAVAFAHHAPSTLQLGMSAAVDGTILASGSLRTRGPNELQQGSVYIFDLEPK